jgi:ribosomal protein S27AE
MICFHKYGKIENGYQYCSKCGKAIIAPINRAECDHNFSLWKTILSREYACSDWKTVQQRKCSNCGYIETETKIVEGTKYG